MGVIDFISMEWGGKKIFSDDNLTEYFGVVKWKRSERRV
jgi:hypothetical protein